MTLAVLVPAYNEQESIRDVLSRIPTSLPDVDSVRVFVIDDGSTDRTGQIARECGATVLSHAGRLGLAAAFRTGVHAALSAGCDLLVTLDADGQYKPEEITLLLARMRRTGADIVVGDRCVQGCAHMPAGNRAGNRIGSWMLRALSATTVTDASSGFRIFNAKSARMLRITSRHTYTHEMLIQARALGLAVEETAVTFLPRAFGKSKLVRTLRRHILRSVGTILRSLFLFDPLRRFLTLAAASMIVGIVSSSIALFTGDTNRYGALVVAGAFFLFSLQFVLIGLISDHLAASRRAQAQQDALSRLDA